MADHNDSDCATCENSDLFQTALDNNFSDLNISSEIKEISRITNDALTPQSPGLKPTDDNFYHLNLPQECAKEFFQSSTPKRSQPVWKPGHSCGLLQSQTRLLVRLGDFRNSTKDTSGNHSHCQQNSTNTHEARKAISAPNFSVSVREHRQQIVLSPFSQKIQNIILQQDSARKRKRRIEMSRKAQRASLRV